MIKILDEPLPGDNIKNILYAAWQYTDYHEGIEKVQFKFNGYLITLIVEKIAESPRG